jgi:hypothetical protein
MLADLESSVLEHHPLNGMLADFPSTPVLTGATIYLSSSNPWLLKRNSRRFSFHELVDSHIFIACSYGARYLFSSFSLFP